MCSTGQKKRNSWASFLSTANSPNLNTDKMPHRMKRKIRNVEPTKNIRERQFQTLIWPKQVRPTVMNEAPNMSDIIRSGSCDKCPAPPVQQLFQTIIQQSTLIPSIGMCNSMRWRPGRVRNQTKSCKQTYAPRFYKLTTHQKLPC